MKNWFRTASSSAPEEKTVAPSHLGVQNSASKIESKSVADHAPLIALHLQGRAVWTPRDYGALSRQGFQKNAI